MTTNGPKQSGRINGVSGRITGVGLYFVANMF